MGARIGPQEPYSPAQSLPAGAVQTSNIVDSAVDYSKVAAGAVIGHASAEYATYASCATLFPQDDSKPQITEGTQILSITYQPKLATSKLLLSYGGMWANSGTSKVAALFRDAGPDALDVVQQYGPGDNFPCSMWGEKVVDAGSTASTTFTVRVGGGGAAVKVNGDTGARWYGGSLSWKLILREIKA